MRRSAILLLLVGLLSLPRQAHAQALVLDVANLAQNVIQALQTIIMVGNQVLELTGVDSLVLDSAFQADMDSLQDLVTNAQGLSYDLQSLNAQITTLFDLSTAPNGTTALRQRLIAIRQIVFESYVYALRTQTLLRTTLSTIQHVTGLVAAIEGFVGNQQANQNLVQYQATITKTLSTLQAQTSAAERARSVERLERVLTEHSIEAIQQAIMEDYPN
jgi:conjugal transfer/entry exclusion protein